VLGGVVIELQEHVEVLGDLRGGCGPLGAVGVGERMGGGLGVLAVFAPGWADLGSALSTLAILWNQHRCSRVSGNTSRTAAQKPSAPSPMASTRAAMPRRLHERSKSAHDWVDSRWPSSSVISSLVPSARTPDHHQQAHLVLLEADLEVDPVDPHVHVVGVLQRALV